MHVRLSMSVGPTVCIIFFPHHMLISFFLKWNTYPQLKERAKTFFFSEKFRFSLKWAKLVQKGSSIRFFEIFEKFIHCYLLDLLYNESSYYLLYFNANHSSGKILVPIMSQNTLSQLDCSVLKSAIYLGWIDEFSPNEGKYRPEKNFKYGRFSPSASQKRIDEMP